MIAARAAVLLFIVLAGAQQVRADTDDADATMEELIVTGRLSRTSATKSDTPIMETARSVAIVPERLIIDRGALNLDNTLTYTAGVTGQPYGFDTRVDSVFVRGLEAPQYRDSLQSLFGYYNNPRPDIYTIEQVEVLKGPAGALYGKGSPGGLVNIVSKRPLEETRRELLGRIGNFNYAEAAMDFTGKVDDNSEWLYRFIAVYRDTDTQVNHVEDNRRVVAPSITWRPTDRTDVTMLLNYNKTESDVGAQFLQVYGTLFPAPNGQRIDNDAYMGDTRFNKYDAESKGATVLANHEINDIWSMEVNARYTDAKADYLQAYPSFIGGDRFVYNPDGTLYKNGTVPRDWYRGDSTSEQAAIDVRGRADFTTGPVGHRLLTGTQYQKVTTGMAGYYALALGYNFLTGQPNNTLGDKYWINVFDPVSFNAPSQQELEDTMYRKQPDVKSTDVGVYLSDEMSIGKWIPTLGVRYDNTDTDNGVLTQGDDAVSASAGLLYQFNNGWAPYVSYADTFEPVIGDNGKGQALEPQEGRQIEAGIKWEPVQFPALITLAAFDIEQTNLADPLSLPGTYEQQSGKAKIKGVELESQATLGDFFWQLNVSQLDTENADGYRIASVPDTQASSWLSYRPTGEWAGFKAGAGVRYIGDSYGGMDIYRTSSYTLGDAMIGYEWRGWDFMLNVTNINDKDFLATCLDRGDCFPGTRRTVVGSIRYVF